MQLFRFLSYLQMLISKEEQNYSIDFIVVRRAVFWNLIAADAPIKEQDLTPQDVIRLIEDVGNDYVSRNKRGLTISSYNVLQED